MPKEFKNKLRGTLLVSLGLAMTLVPFSMLIGWNLLTANSILVCIDAGIDNLFAGNAVK